MPVSVPPRVQLVAKTEFFPPADVPWETDADGGQALAEFAGRACYQSWTKPNPVTATNAGYLRHILEVGHVALRELAVGEVPVPDELVAERPGHPGQVHAHGAVLEDRQVADLEDVPQVALVGRRRRVGLGPGLVAGPAGELRERLPAVRIGVPRHVLRRQELRPCLLYTSPSPRDS